MAGSPQSRRNRILPQLRATPEPPGDRSPGPVLLCRVPRAAVFDHTKRPPTSQPTCYGAGENAANIRVGAFGKPSRKRCFIAPICFALHYDALLCFTFRNTKRRDVRTDGMVRRQVRVQRDADAARRSPPVQLGLAARAPADGDRLEVVAGGFDFVARRGMRHGLSGSERAARWLWR